MVNNLSNKYVFMIAIIGLAFATLSSIAFISTLQISIGDTALLAGNSHLASTLGISAYAAKKAVDIIDAASAVVSIISLIGIVTGGAGAISYAIVATAKYMIRNYGKKYAAAW
ncbi:hypothetical protein JCM21714_1416 [Gracilibacillus boraciitolerans JCM 21714]|uniref:Circular bacteriocin, circularin A/uberolysin family n=1 Tax=Gracilibacillus boraciitolerans JCM 21714 TaxID=1298598 RepID=W4VHZ4_9BACI|nr:uberolysin/carnocyclin family circular bacteriocin [Gracilibacillus boraciitolerans]GAE92418.1 hypothetical protein JCM21714_1416 [Gracilibacillus boraciitolerans JCM 21714]